MWICFLWSRLLDLGDLGLGFLISFDVYSFGEVLMEFVLGKFGISGIKIDFESEVWLEWVLLLINVYDKEFLFKLVDLLFIVDEDLFGEVWVIVIIVCVCFYIKFYKWFSMCYVLKVLENLYKVV